MDKNKGSKFLFLHILRNEGEQTEQFVIHPFGRKSGTESIKKKSGSMSPVIDGFLPPSAMEKKGLVCGFPVGSPSTFGRVSLRSRNKKWRQEKNKGADARGLRNYSKEIFELAFVVLSFSVVKNACETNVTVLRHMGKARNLTPERKFSDRWIAYRFISQGLEFFIFVIKFYSTHVYF